MIVGADRVARNGDVCNKIGTYDKALAARDNDVPFYVALPSPTIDWRTHSGDAIPIESRGDDEVLQAAGRDDSRRSGACPLAPAGTRAVNYAFDVTPARLVTGLITERGIAASGTALAAMFADSAPAERGFLNSSSRSGNARRVLAPDSSRSCCPAMQIPGMFRGENCCFASVGSGCRPVAHRRQFDTRRRCHSAHIERYSCGHAGRAS